MRNIKRYVHELRDSGFRVEAAKVEERTLTQDLREVAEEHHAYEELLGEPDADWQGWYAQQLLARGWRL
jgi:uncharacterized LabA/DUF88 family protein